MSERDAIVAVTEADRELATAIRIALYRAWPDMPSYPDNIVPQVIARHRTTHAGEVERLREALDRQCDNMAFVLNKATLPDQWYCKFSNELQEARQALEASR